MSVALRTLSIIVPQLGQSSSDESTAASRCYDQAGVGSIDVDLTDGSEIETLTLTETDVVNFPGLFEGLLPTDETSDADNDGALSISQGDLVTVTYDDPADDTGSPLVVNISFDVANKSTESVHDASANTITITPQTSTAASANLDVEITVDNAGPDEISSTVTLRVHLPPNASSVVDDGASPRCSRSTSPLDLTEPDIEYEVNSPGRISSGQCARASFTVDVTSDGTCTYHNYVIFVEVVSGSSQQHSTSFIQYFQINPP